MSTPAMAITAKNVSILLTPLRSGADGLGGAGEPISSFKQVILGLYSFPLGRGKV